MPFGFLALKVNPNLLFFIPPYLAQAQDLGPSGARPTAEGRDSMDWLPAMHSLVDRALVYRE